jgi:hypothetical protein
MKTQTFSASIAMMLSASIAPHAFAHFDLDSAGTHKSRYGRSEIKQGPCGRKDGLKGSTVYTYEPGQTIKISVDEFIPHPGYFRVSFAKDSDTEFVNPQTIDPINRKCMNDPRDKCGKSDFFNNPGVLGDNLSPHKRGFPGTRYSWDIKLPEVECDNCTLQVIQVMTDAFPIHAPYDPSYESEDIYYQCIDIKLEKK